MQHQGWIVGDFLQCSCYKFIKLRVAVTHNHNQIVWGLLSVCVCVCIREESCLKKTELEAGRKKPQLAKCLL